MSIIIKNSQVYAPAPEGLLNAVLVGIKDEGIKSTPFGERPRVRFDFDTENKTPEGTPYRVSKWFTPSLSAKSSLTKDLNSWLRRDVSRDEQLDIEALIGLKAQILIVNVVKDGKTYSNIERIFPAKEVA